MTRSQQILRYIREATDEKEVAHIPAPSLNQHHPIYHTTYAPVFHSGAPQSSSTTTMTSNPGAVGSSSASPSYSSPTETQDYTSGGSGKMDYSDNKPKGMSKAKHFLHGTALGAGAAVGGLYAYGQHLAHAAKAAGGM